MANWLKKLFGGNKQQDAPAPISGTPTKRNWLQKIFGLGKSKPRIEQAIYDLPDLFAGVREKVSPFVPADETVSIFGDGTDPEIPIDPAVVETPAETNWWVDMDAGVRELRSGEWVHVYSSNVDKIRYLWDAQAMEIRFLSQALYRYDNVEPQLYLDFIAFDSPGRFVWQRLRPHPGKYPYVRLEAPTVKNPKPRVLRHPNLQRTRAST